jgi:thiamine biosynthesis lipoprotein ApbE
VSVRHPTVAFGALGTTAQVTLTSSEDLEKARCIVSDELRAIDETCSRFRQDSELAWVQGAEGRAVQVSPLLLEALDVAVQAAAVTDGDVDPTVGPALRGLGWDLDFSLVVRRQEPARVIVRPAAGWQTIRIDRRCGTVQVPAGVEIDLGSTAKALAADRSARKVHEATGAGVLISLGGDVATAGRPPGDGWVVRVTDDHRNGSSPGGQMVALQSGCLATSSTMVRRWRAGGAERHHIIDPRTGLPVKEFWRTASVVAASCVEANTASTAAIVRGAAALPWLTELGLPARLVRSDGVVVTVGAWPKEPR